VGTSTTPDATPGNTVTVVVPVASNANLTLTKVSSVLAGNATSGQTISYTVTLVNLGPSVAQNVTLTDFLSPGQRYVSSSSNVAGGGTGTFSGSTSGATTVSLAVGGTLSLVMNVNITATTGNITNTAVGTSTTPDNTPNNTVTVVLPVAAVADLTVTKVASVTVGTSGGTISYTVTLVNLGPSVAQNVTLTDFLSAGQRYISSSSNIAGGGTGTFNGSTSGATTGQPGGGRHFEPGDECEHHGNDRQHHQHGGRHQHHA
jgi:uncharacterized repeat protein (TIGR01451 family)